MVTVNKAFCDITGYTREEVLGSSETAVRNALQPPEFYDELSAIVQILVHGITAREHDTVEQYDIADLELANIGIR